MLIWSAMMGIELSLDGKNEMDEISFSMIRVEEVREKIGLSSRRKFCQAFWPQTQVLVNNAKTELKNRKKEPG